MKTLIDYSKSIFERKGLLYERDDEKVEMSKTKKDKNGAPLPVNGCSYNFNRDVDALCFKRAMERFVRTGAKEDAFDVYFCHSEIFDFFGGYKDGIDSLLQLLYDHEANSATLLKKHRDHYSHSVYVYALGIAIYAHNKPMRDAFKSRFGEGNADGEFLKYWGVAALFHDIGYPYEISFRQVQEYAIKTEQDENRRLKMRYDNLEGFVNLTAEEVAKCGEFMPKGKSDINSLLIAAFLHTFKNSFPDKRMGAAALEESIKNQVENPDSPKDHGYFSAVLLLKKLLKRDNFVLTRPMLDAVTAIFLHNFYRFTYQDVAKKAGIRYEHMHVDEQPLAYLLSLCDELQCWDRLPYGSKSKTQELPWDIDLAVSDSKIEVKYHFDKGDDNDATAKISSLADEIKVKFLDWEEIARLEISYDIKKRDKKVYDYFSDSKFIDLCKIAEAINISYETDCNSAGITDYMRGRFDDLTLEYQLSNIAQAKHYVRHLEKIHCFFSDRRLDYPAVEQFSEEELALLAVNEHIRWVNEKVGMGWHYGTNYTNRAEREQKRINADIVPYDELASDEQYKDRYPINNMIKHLAAHGIKIYRLQADKKARALGCTGHVDLSRIAGFDEEKVRGEVRTYLRGLKENYSLTLYSGFAYGADLLFAEEAIKCGIDVVAVLPYNWDKFMKEHADGGKKLMQLLGQAREVVIKPHVLTAYLNVSRYVVQQCDELLALWDGVELPLKDGSGEPNNLGGTYDTIKAARAAGKAVKLF